VPAQQTTSTTHSKLTMPRAMIVCRVVFYNARSAAQLQAQFAISATDSIAIPRLASVYQVTMTHSILAMRAHTTA
jgi:hypothetical protein